MKKTLNISLLAVLSVFIFSCKNSVDLVKRHYNKGYYIASNSGKQKSKGKLNSSVPNQIQEMKSIPQMNTNNEVQENDLIASLNTESTQTTKAKKIETFSKPESVSSGTDKVHSKSKETLVITQKHHTSVPSAGGGSDDIVFLILLVILSILLPPLAVFLKDSGSSKWFMITLVLCLLAILGAWFFMSSLGGLWFVAFIIALLCVFDII